MTQRRASVCLLIGLLSVVVLVSSPAVAEPLAVFRADLAHTGVYSSPALPAFHGVKWKLHTGGPVISSPSILDGTVYVGSSDHMMKFWLLMPARWKCNSRPLTVRVQTRPV